MTSAARSPAQHTVTLRGADRTHQAGLALGRVARAGDCLALVGDLGAGKTCFVQGLAAGLDVPAGVRVTSPTFTLVNEYRGGRIDLVHADLYRLDDVAELDELGLYEACDSGAVVAIEWAEKFSVLPADHLRIALVAAVPGARELAAAALGPDSAELLAAWMAVLARPEAP